MYVSLNTISQVNPPDLAQSLSRCSSTQLLCPAKSMAAVLHAPRPLPLTMQGPGAAVGLLSYISASRQLDVSL